LQTKLLDDQSKPDEAVQTVALYVHGTLNKSDLVSKHIAFSGDNYNKIFGGVACPSTNNVFTKLKDSVKYKLAGVDCPAHILNNCNMEWTL
jgi:hypothetical protein